MELPAFTGSPPKRLAVKLTATGERIVRQGHPWIFSDRIQKINKEGAPGDIAVIFSQHKNDVIGVGLFDPASPIRIKMLQHNGPASINADFFADKVQRAYALRLPLFESDTNSYRLLFGENDGLPGLIADVYADVLVLKVYSAIWFPFLDMLQESLLEISGASAMVLRMGRNVQKADTHGLKEGQLIFGDLLSESIEFKEHGITFEAHVVQGHKTGFFLDHRENRRLAGKLAKGKSVLDVFCYAGGFSVHALVGGAKKVISLDISAQALEQAKRNAQRNPFEGTHETLCGDAFEILETMVAGGETFDLVIIDPPSFAKREKEVEKAKKQYEKLARLGTRLTAPKGTLVLASCSSRVSATDFFSINEAALVSEQRKYRVQDTTFHDIDHPVGFPEGAYLKCAYYRLD